ncbi:MAG: DUF5615 family PIN-like protein [Myxococcales bacterium]|nr:DUF5615 family PIN-like protein [Myxococcales bacterium]
MLRFLADENFNNDIVRGLRRRGPHVDVSRVQDVGLCGADDDAVLEHAAAEARLLLTHDTSTLIARAWARVECGASMPGVVAVEQTAAVGPIVEDLLLLALCSDPEEWSCQVLYLPLR